MKIFLRTIACKVLFGTMSSFFSSTDKKYLHLPSLVTSTRVVCSRMIGQEHFFISEPVNHPTLTQLHGSPGSSWQETRSWASSSHCCCSFKLMTGETPPESLLTGDNAESRRCRRWDDHWGLLGQEWSTGVGGWPGDGDSWHVTWWSPPPTSPQHTIEPKNLKQKAFSCCQWHRFAGLCFRFSSLIKLESTHNL